MHALAQYAQIGISQLQMNSQGLVIIRVGPYLKPDLLSHRISLY